MLGERLLKRFWQFVRLGVRGCDQPVDLQRDRLDERATLPVAEHGGADLDRVGQQPGKPGRIALQLEVTGHLDDRAPEAGLAGVEPMLEKLDLRLLRVDGNDCHRWCSFRLNWMTPPSLRGG